MPRDEIEDWKADFKKSGPDTIKKIGDLLEKNWAKKAGWDVDVEYVGTPEFEDGGGYSDPAYTTEGEIAFYVDKGKPLFLGDTVVHTTKDYGITLRFEIVTLPFGRDAIMNINVNVIGQRDTWEFEDIELAGPDLERMVDKLLGMFVRNVDRYLLSDRVVNASLNRLAAEIRRLAAEIEG